MISLTLNTQKTECSSSITLLLYFAGVTVYVCTTVRPDPSTLSTGTNWADWPSIMLWTSPQSTSSGILASPSGLTGSCIVLPTPCSTSCQPSVSILFYAYKEQSLCKPTSTSVWIILTIRQLHDQRRGFIIGSQL